MPIQELLKAQVLLLFLANFAQAGLAIPFDNVGAGAPSGSSNFEILPFRSKWDPGTNTASFFPTPNPPSTPFPMSPGGASWSAMPTGVPISGLRPDDQADHPANAKSTDIGTLIPGKTATEVYDLFDSAFNVWAAAASITNLGKVVDGFTSSFGETGGEQSSGSHLGDIRVGAYQFNAPEVLAHAYPPITEALISPTLGGTIGGDIHFDLDRLWSDDDTDTTSDSDFDFFTVALHELGHALGLDHSDVVGSVMFASYTGARRTLSPDDIAGIRAIYSVPEPSAFLFGCLIVGVGVVGSWKKLASKQSEATL